MAIPDSLKNGIQSGIDFKVRCPKCGHYGLLDNVADCELDALCKCRICKTPVVMAHTEFMPKRVVAKVGTVEIDVNACGFGSVTIDGKPIAARSVMIEIHPEEVPKVLIDVSPIKMDAAPDLPSAKPVEPQAAQSPVKPEPQQGAATPLSGFSWWRWWSGRD